MSSRRDRPPTWQRAGRTRAFLAGHHLGLAQGRREQSVYLEQLRRVLDARRAELDHQARDLEHRERGLARVAELAADLIPHPRESTDTEETTS